MSTTTKNKSQKGVRYTDAQKKEVVDFALSYNAANGRGGQSKAADKFKISQITIASWLKAAGTSAPKTAPAAKAPEAAKTTPATKAPKAAKAVKAPKAAGKSKGGTRYTDAQKKEVTNFVASYNAANGRGGQSKAAEKYGVSPLTVMAWLKASGAPAKVKKAAKKAVKPATPTKAPQAAKVAKPSKSGSSESFDAKLSSLLALSREITRSEAALAQLIGKFNSLKASL